MSIDRRLADGPLRVRALWSDEQTAALPQRIIERRRRQFVVRGSLASSAVLVLLLIWSPWQRVGSAPGLDAGEARVRPPTAPLTAPTTTIQPKGDSATRPILELSDGSRVYADSVKQLSIEQQLEGYIVTRVLSGTVSFEVNKNPKRVFEVDAGQVRVQVIGTTFSVARHRDRAEVEVTEGTVRVIWPDGDQVLTAGQRGWFPPEAGEAEAGETEAGETEAGGSEPTPVSRSQRVAVSPPAVPGWRELARDEDYEASYAALKKDRGRGTAPRSASDLMLAADVARLSLHPAEAVRLLSRVSAQFPSDPRAPLAEFTRGRVLMENLGNPAQAAQAFARARSLSPGGSLAQDALSREIDATLGASQTARAKSLARLYLSSYPEGRHRAKCEKLVRSD